jgi:hypothetical protein
MAWDDCTYITQSSFYSASVQNYQASFSQCVSEVNMSSSIYVTEISESKLYINYGSQSGSLIYTSPTHSLTLEENEEEIGSFETGSFCPKCKAFYKYDNNRDNINWVSYKGLPTILSESQFREYSASFAEVSASFIKSFIPEDSTQSSYLFDMTKPVSSRTVTSGSNDNTNMRFWID